MRIRHTLPSVVMATIRLADRFRAKLDSEHSLEREKKLQALFKFMHQTVSVLAKAEHFDLALRLFLLPIQKPSLFVGYEMIAYEFVVQAFTIYEESVADSSKQQAALGIMLTTLQNLSNTGVFSVENYDTLVTKIALYGSKLLKKPDQCRIVMQCAYLFWGRDTTADDMKRIRKLTEGEDGKPVENWVYREGKRVLECLQKCLKIADSCMDSLTNAQLFVEILDYYIVFFEKKNPAVRLQCANCV
jgi:vacuolar protein sorting-associated protein 35